MTRKEQTSSSYPKHLWRLRTALIVSLVLALLASGMPLVRAEGTASAPSTQTFTPCDDAYAVRQWARYQVDGVNHDGQHLRVQSATDDFAQSYLQFDLSTFPSNQSVMTATLRLHKTAGPDSTYPLDIYRIGEDWLEDTLGTTDEVTPWLWLGDKLTTRLVGPANDRWVECDVTDEVNYVLHGHATPARLLNLGLGTETRTLVWGTPALTFTDREGTEAQRPQVVLTYDSDAPWADAGQDGEWNDWPMGCAIDPNAAGSEGQDLVYSFDFVRTPGGSQLTTTDWWQNDSAEPRRAYFQPDVHGTYIVRLTVRDANGLTDQDTARHEVLPTEPDHPRIWLTPERVADLQQRAAKPTAEWTRLRSTLDQYMDTPYESLYGQANFVMAYALAYQVLRDIDYPIAKVYADKAIELMDYMVDHDVDISADSYLYFGDIAGGLAVGYDWCHDELMGPKRSKVVDQLNDWVDEAFEMTPEAYYAVEHRPEVNRYYAHLYGMALIGLATPWHNAPRAQEYVDAVREQIAKEVEPFMERYGDGGDWSEGWNYVQPTMRHLLLTYEAIRSVYGEDLYRDTAFPEGLLAFMIHGTLPDLGHGYPEGDLWESTATIGDDHRCFMLLLTDEFADDQWGPYGQHWLEHSVTSPDWNSTPDRMFSDENVFYDFLWGDPDRASRSFDGLWPAYYASGGGTVFAREDWSDDALWLSFHCGGFLTDHLHRAHNHLNIWRGEWLAYDANLGAGYAYNPEPWYHNVVVIDDADQSNYAVGRMVRFEDTGDTVYALGNATPAMWYMDWTAGAPVYVADHYTRSFVYWRPDTICVLDRVTARRASDPKRWLLNVPAQPSIQGDQFTVTGPEGKGRLICQTLWPENAGIASVRLSSLNPSAGLQGWQVQVTPPTLRADDVFLHVLNVSDAESAGAASAFDVVRIQATQGNMIGAHFRNPSGNRLVLFSADPQARPPTGQVVYSFQPTADTRHRLTNLVPGRAYAVTVHVYGASHEVTVQPGTGFRASAQGMLGFTTTTGGRVLPAYWRVYMPLVMRE